MAVNNQSPPSSNPLASQPLPNSKGGIKMVQTARESADSEDGYEEAKEDEMDEVADVADEEKVSSLDKEEEFLNATVYGGNEEKPEDLLEKCADPGPCFVMLRNPFRNPEDHRQVHRIVSSNNK
ncbi:hypothetical protein PIB30_083217 [Stylosanthes scabra]|uniref:Uncharacterized protein n=1 Tax=Stylosanthes scabra TaxID=79078 RepID=A0ABU6TSN5_9FABA|nr:hypothetical protein [Stylosanthes scabra]